MKTRCRAVSTRAWWLGIASPVVFGSAAIADTNSDATRGYNGSAALGYNGSAALGYNGSAALGYNGSAALGYNGSAALGYNGSAALGYNGSAALGYNGSAALGYNGSSALDSGRSCTTSFAPGITVAAMGSIESVYVSGDKTILGILGQVFEVGVDVTYAVGDYVVAAVGPAQFGTIVYHLGTAYVPGVSSVRIRGQITSVDPSVGTVSLGAATIDYTALLSSNPSLAAQVDQTFEAEGIQPLAKGSVIARPDKSGAVGCEILHGRM